MKRLIVQPWISNGWQDSLFILLPSFLSLLAVIVFPGVFQQQQLTEAWWVLLVLLIDVAHVYSTLYRTYFDKNAYREHKTKLLLIPFTAFVILVLLYTQSTLWFWRLMAYTAVFHFIRQQYGFMRIYSRKENVPAWHRRTDAVTIYTATLYPIVYWHLSADRNFDWFTDGDFFNLSALQYLNVFFFTVYIAILAVYLVKESIYIHQTGYVNIPRNAVIAGTVLSWYFGIVYFNGDMAFTLLNVVSHGIPYMALIWMYGKRTTQSGASNPGKLMRLVFSRYGIVLFLGIIFLLAFIEEGLWDFTVWKEHARLFNVFYTDKVRLHADVLNLVVPLLALPQVTHYIIDGFIWRIKKNDLKWSE